MHGKSKAAILQHSAIQRFSSMHSATEGLDGAMVHVSVKLTSNADTSSLYLPELRQPGDGPPRCHAAAGLGLHCGVPPPPPAEQLLPPPAGNAQHVTVITSVHNSVDVTDYMPSMNNRLGCLPQQRECQHNQAALKLYLSAGYSTCTN